MGTESTTSVSVVVIARNEAERIRGCLDSVLALGGDDEPAEVLLVDSNSTDGTVAVVREYPITVLRIPSDELSTPGAGRQVGFRHASGDLVLFVDGDVHLTDGWLATAVRAVQRSPDVAGVDGRVAEVDARTAHDEARVGTASPAEGEEAVSQPDGGESPPSGPVDGEAVEHLAAVALYDADTLDRVGGFDPWLNSMEDVDLGYRLRRADYRLVRLPVLVGAHPKTVGLAEIRRRWQVGFMHGDGQALRKSLADPGMLANWLSFYWFHLAAGLWLTIAGLLAAFGGRRPRRAWLAAGMVGFSKAVVSRGPGWMLLWAATYVPLVTGIAVGFLRYDPDQGEYPFERVEVLQAPESNRA